MGKNKNSQKKAAAKKRQAAAQNTADKSVVVTASKPTEIAMTEAVDAANVTFEQTTQDDNSV